MSNVIGQPDISDRQLRTNPKSKASEWTEIGEATVTRTIFGGAKVRIIRKHDKIRRVLSLIIVIAIVVLGWLGWLAFQRMAPLQNGDSLLHLGSKKEKSDVPKSSIENIPSPVKAATVRPSSTETGNLTASQKSEIHHVLKDSGQIVAKPSVSQPLKTSGTLAVASPRVMQTAASSPLAVSPNKVSSSPVSVAGERHTADVVDSSR